MKSTYLLIIFLGASIFGRAQWFPVSVPSTAMLDMVTFTDTIHGTIITSDGMALLSSDGGTTWQSVSTGTANILTDLSFTGTTIAYSVGDNGSIVKTTNGGSNWSMVNSPTGQVLRGCYFSDPNAGWICGQGESIYRTTNGGTNWTQQMTGAYWLRHFSFPTPQVGYCAGDGMTVYKTTNGGLSWTRLPGAGTINFFEIQFLTVDTGYVCGLGGYVAKTCNGGQTWQSLNTGTTAELECIWFFNSQVGYAGGESGTLIKTTNGGLTWTPEASGTTNRLRRFFFFNQDKGFISGHNGTLLRKGGCLPAPGNIAGPGHACQGDSGKVYQVVPVPGATGYTWATPPGTVITAGNNTPVITVKFNPNAGTGTFSVSASAPGCSSLFSPPLYVQVDSLPVPVIIGNAHMCANSGLYNYSTQTGMASYTWSISSGGQITWGQGTNHVQIEWLVSGPQWVRVSTTNSGGCTSPTPANLNVTVDSPPDPAGLITGPSLLCAGSTQVNYSVASIPNTISYVWLLPPGTHIVSGNWTNQPVVDFDANASSGQMTVYGNNLCGNGSPSPAMNIIVNPLPPAPVITLNGDTLFSNAPSGNQWYYNQSMIPGATGTFLVATADGDYQDLVTIDSCTSPGSEVVHFEVTGLNQLSSESLVVIAPNPNFGKFTIRLQSFKNKCFSVSAVNSTGLELFRKDDLFSDGTGTVLIDLHEIPKGFYFVSVFNEYFREVHKVVVLR